MECFSIIIHHKLMVFTTTSISVHKTLNNIGFTMQHRCKAWHYEYGYRQKNLNYLKVIFFGDNFLCSYKAYLSSVTAKNLCHVYSLRQSPDGIIMFGLSCTKMCEIQCNTWATRHQRWGIGLIRRITWRYRICHWVFMLLLSKSIVHTFCTLL